MRLRPISITYQSRCAQQRFSSIATRKYHSLLPVQTIDRCFDGVDLDEFKQKAFIPMKPVVMRARCDESVANLKEKRSIKVASKWFVPASTQSAKPPSAKDILMPSIYLDDFEDTIIPYELTIDSNDMRQHLVSLLLLIKDRFGLAEQLRWSLVEQYDPQKAFYRFYGPFSLFLSASRSNYDVPLYIAQAQIADLPSQLRDDIPTPKVVKEAGKGDIYDANIWMGTSTSYTPLHKDPNPNLFIQLVSKKKVRIFPPKIGVEIYQGVQQSIGASGFASMRGEEMMEGPERSLLEERVWGQGVRDEGFEVDVGPGDALFIPTGWWHSIKSTRRGINASVNWWFR